MRLRADWSKNRLMYHIGNKANILIKRCVLAIVMVFGVFIAVNRDHDITSDKFHLLRLSRRRWRMAEVKLYPLSEKELRALSKVLTELVESSLRVPTATAPLLSAALREVTTGKRDAFRLSN
jgi:hypothetical protein